MRALRMRGRTALKAYLFLSLPLLYYAFFYVYPLGYTGFLSMHRWELSDLSTRFVGLKNYIRFLTSEESLNVLKVTGLFILGVVPLRTAIALGLALLLNRRIPGRTFFRFAFFSPMVVSFIAASMVWLWIYEPQAGLANYLLSSLGLPKLRWLSTEGLALVSLIIMTAWKSMGFYMVVYLAGLQDIPQMLYEAAEMDGAGPLWTFRMITFPLLSRVTTFVLIMSIIFDFRVFEPIFVMTGGGPLGSTEIFTFYLYKQGFMFYEMGYASAIAFVGSGIILAFTLLQWKLRKDW